VDVELEAEGGPHEDEGLQVEVPRGERLESGKDLLEVADKLRHRSRCCL